MNKNISIPTEHCLYVSQILSSEQEALSENYFDGEKGDWKNEEFKKLHSMLDDICGQLLKPKKEITIVIWYGHHDENDVLNALNTNDPDAGFSYTTLTFSDDDERPFNMLQNAMYESYSASHCMLVYIPFGESEYKIKKTFDSHNFPPFQALVAEVHEEKEFEVELKQTIVYGKKVRVKAQNKQEALRIAHEVGKHDGEQIPDLDQYEPVEIMGGCFDYAEEISKYKTEMFRNN